MDWSKFFGRRMVLALITILLTVLKDQLNLTDEELKYIVTTTLGTIAAITTKDTVVLFKQPSEGVPK